MGLFLLNSLTVFSQSIELIGGVNRNNFFTYQEETAHFSSSYTPGYGYTIQIAIENVKVDWITARFTLSVDKYGGELDATDGGLGGAWTTKAKIDKSIFSLGVFPFNFKIANRIDLNLGFEVSGLIHETFRGTKSGWQMGQSYWSYDLNDKYDRYSSNLYFGLNGRVAYDFNIYDKWAISPQYSYYYGLMDEFVEFPKKTRSMRHYFCIGLQRKIK